MGALLIRQQLASAIAARAASRTHVHRRRAANHASGHATLFGIEIARLSRMQEAPPTATMGSRGSEIVDLGAPDAIPLGEGRAYCLAGRAIAVFRTREGGLYA